MARALIPLPMLSLGIGARIGTCRQSAARIRIGAIQSAHLRPPRDSSRRRQRGQAVIETALIMPILLLAVMGLVDFGRVYFSRAQLENGVSEGARYAALDRTDSAVKAKTKAYAGTLALADSDITVQCYSGSTNTVKDCAAAVAGDTVGVRVTIAFQPITPLIGNIVGNALSISAASRRTAQ